jgi:hypothetical protein
MSRIPRRATYALDKQTNRRIKRLAKDWNVSQTEVIRRAVRVAAEKSARRLTPAEVVALYAKRPLPRNEAQTRIVIGFLRELRHASNNDAHNRSTLGTL